MLISGNRPSSPPSFIGWGQTPIPGRFFQSSYAKMHMPSAFPILFGIIHVPFDSFISQNEGNAEHVRLSSVRLAGGCSAAFVSPNGLVQTNHHCARSCIQQLSTATKDFSVTGFYAREIKDEVKCPEIEVNQLIDIRDVTDRVRKSTDGK